MWGNIAKALLSGSKKVLGNTASKVVESAKTHYIKPIVKSVKRTFHSHKATPEAVDKLAGRIARESSRPKTITKTVNNDIIQKTTQQTFISNKEAQKRAKKMILKRNIMNKISGPFDTLLNVTTPYWNNAGKITKSPLGSTLIKGGIITTELSPVGYEVYKSMKTNNYSEINNFGVTGSIAGTILGGVGGAVVGSHVPIVGTAVGGYIGATTGGLGLSVLEDYLFRKKKKAKNQEDKEAIKNTNFDNNIDQNSDQNSKNDNKSKSNNLTDKSIELSKKFEKSLEKKGADIYDNVHKTIDTTKTIAKDTALGGIVAAGAVSGGLPGAALSTVGALAGKDFKTSAGLASAGAIGGTMINNSLKKKKKKKEYLEN